MYLTFEVNITYKEYIDMEIFWNFSFKLESWEIFWMIWYRWLGVRKYIQYFCCGIEAIFLFFCSKLESALRRTSYTTSSVKWTWTAMLKWTLESSCRWENILWLQLSPLVVVFAPQCWTFWVLNKTWETINKNNMGIEN